jgi:amidase
VRIPAYCCGVVGLRVGHGRIPSFNPSMAAAAPIGSQLMATQGPLTRSVRDARLALAVMARGDPRDTRWADAPLIGPAVARPVRAALLPELPGGFTHPAQAAAVRQAGRHLAAAGYAVEEVAPPEVEAVVAVWHRIGSTDVFGALAPNVEKYGDDDAKTSMRLWLELSPPADLPTVLGALAQRDLLLRRWLTFMMRYPVIVMMRYPVIVLPTLCDLPPPHGLDLTKAGQAQVLDSLRASLIAPTLGLPGLAVPVGTHGRLRPGVQILAGRFREDLCLDAGEVIEAAEGVVTPIDPQG